MKDKLINGQTLNKNGQKNFPMLNVDGLNVPFYFDEEKVRQGINLEARPGDIFVVTYPKCGTTWMRYIVWSIQNLAQSPLPSMEELSYKIAPYLERAGSDVASRLPSPRTLNVHFPYEYTPFHTDAKYIYVARNPRDTCVSYYHFTRESIGGSGYTEATFDEYFELFLNGHIPYGDYFDHIRRWHENKRNGNVLFLTYEDMLQDPGNAILQVARFISDSDHDYEQVLTSDNNSILDKVIENTTFKNMKDMPVVIRSATSTSCGDASLDTGVRVNFFRKGVVGDWMNHFSSDQVYRLDKKMSEKWTGTGLDKLWF